MEKLQLATSIRYLKGVGPKMAKRLQRLGILTINDLINYFPFRHQDYSLVSPINAIQPGETITVKVEIVEIKNNYTRFRKQIQKAKVKDKTGILDVIWFNQPFLARNLKPGMIVGLSGKVKEPNHRQTLISPEYEVLSEKGDSLHTGRLVPIYSETYGVSSKYLRKLVSKALEIVNDQIEEFLPPKILRNHQLIPEKQAVLNIHFPKNKTALCQARKRLGFDELFFIHLNNLFRKKSWQIKKPSFKFKIDREKILKFIASLPFKLTGAQNKALEEISDDLAKNKPMNRLLQGDVGSGKTVVAAIASYIAFLNRTQSAIMAPTEILAQQHYQTIKNILGPFGLKIKLLTSSSSKKKDSQKYDVWIGTHSLIFKRAIFEKLGLVVIDEQHRFGVKQRAKLIKKGKSPHVLSMTATPIPRTIALTFYGDLDLSYLDQMPLGQRKIRTFVIPEEKRPAGYEWLKKRIKENNDQVFIICPLIEESETLLTVKAAKAEYEKLKNEVFENFKIGLLHGRMKSKEKDEILTKMRAGELDILVATPVVEVGIDIPNTSIMFIEAADRFGLAQLHQLRGRIGRRGQEAYCFLMAENPSQRSNRRLKAMEKYDIGIKLAEIDLKMRGPGEIYGLLQHGFPKLKVASLDDIALIKQTKEAAETLVKQSPNLSRFPRIKEKLYLDESLVTPN